MHLLRHWCDDIAVYVLTWNRLSTSDRINHRASCLLHSLARCQLAEHTMTIDQPIPSVYNRRRTVNATQTASYVIRIQLTRSPRCRGTSAQLELTHYVTTGMFTTSFAYIIVHGRRPTGRVYSLTYAFTVMLMRREALLANEEQY